jgi:hypothetical protein
MTNIDEKRDLYINYNNLVSEYNNKINVFSSNNVSENSSLSPLCFDKSIITSDIKIEDSDIKIEDSDIKIKNNKKDLIYSMGLLDIEKYIDEKFISIEDIKFLTINHMENKSEQVFSETNLPENSSLSLSRFDEFTLFDLTSIPENDSHSMLSDIPLHNIEIKDSILVTKLQQKKKKKNKILKYLCFFSIFNKKNKNDKIINLLEENK